MALAVHPAHRAAQRDGDAAPSEDVRRTPAHRRLVVRQDVRRRLDEGDLRPRAGFADAPVDGQRHLDAAGTGPHDASRARGRAGPAPPARRSAPGARPPVASAGRSSRAPARPGRRGRPARRPRRATGRRTGAAPRPRPRRARSTSIRSAMASHEPHPGAGGERGEIDRQVRLRVHALEEARHHAGVVVPGRRRHERDLGAGQRPGGEIGQDVEVGVTAAHQDEPPHGRARASAARPPGAAPLRTAPAAGALRTTPAGSGTARAGVAAARSARARGPRPGTARSEPCASAS